MTKRSAMTMAAGVAIALLLGVAAVSLTIGDTPAAQARGDLAPRIQHQVRTVTIRRPVDAQPTTTRVVQFAAQPAGATTSVGAWEDEGEHESEGVEDSTSFDLSEDGGSGDD